MRATLVVMLLAVAPLARAGYFATCSASCEAYTETAIGCSAILDAQGRCTAGTTFPPQAYGEPAGPLPFMQVPEESLGASCWLPGRAEKYIHCAARVSKVGDGISQSCTCWYVDDDE